MAEQFQLRDIFNKKGVENLGKRIKSNYPRFNERSFVHTINSKLESLSFGDRSRLIQDALIKFLPDNFEELVKILLDSLNDKLEKDDWGDYDCFIVVPQTYVIERLGMDNFDVSMNALYEMTMRCTSEGPIRRFIENYPEKSLKLLKKWTKDKNAHVRRLVSEGTRPRLPLESPIRTFLKDPGPIIPLLEELKDDDELYVRRSVANNLNDISKDNPEVVVNTLKRWIKGASKERMWLIRHSLRTLFKRGNKDALELMGYLKPNVSDVNLDLCQESVKIGASFNFKVSFKSNVKQKLMVDYAVHYMKSNGKNKEKVFKLRIVDADENDVLNFDKKHSFKEMTTRKHHKGKHLLEIIINGELFEKKEFELI
jgi:3-methyladenine DNA glycosylase AlkC